MVMDWMTLIFIKESKMTLINLNLMRILVGVALVSAQIGMVQASQVQQKAPQLVLPEPQIRDKDYGKCYLRKQYDAKYNDLARESGAKGNKLKDMTDKHFFDNARRPCPNQADKPLMHPSKN